MANKFNLEGIKEEMATRRNERNSVSEQLGESVTNNQAKDGFLNGLMTSFSTGRETHATKRIKLIENKVDIREGKSPKFKENDEDIVVLHEANQNRNRGVIPINTNLNPELGQSERDELMYAQMQKKALRGGQSLSESLMSVAGAGGNQNGGGQPIASSQLTEGVKNVVNNYLAENFGLIVEESIKSTILEMYAVQRIKEVLQENKSMIKSIVLEILKEMKAKQRI